MDAGIQTGIEKLLSLLEEYIETKEDINALNAYLEVVLANGSLNGLLYGALKLLQWKGKCESLQLVLARLGTSQSVSLTTRFDRSHARQDIQFSSNDLTATKLAYGPSVIFGSEMIAGG